MSRGLVFSLETIEREHYDMQTIIVTDRYDEVILYDSRSRI